MSAFHEVRLPLRLAFGSSSGVERRTEVITLGSGFERRSTPWAHGRRRFLIGAGLRTIEDAAALIDFFEARRGRLHGFRYRDFLNDQSGPAGAAPTALDQALGSGDGERTAYPLTRAYGDDLRRIHKPVEGTVRLAIDGGELDPSAFAVDLTSGEVTLATPPPAGAAVTAGFRFDTPVRFDTDRLDVTLESFEAGRLAAVPLVELRL